MSVIGLSVSPLSRCALLDEGRRVVVREDGASSAESLRALRERLHAETGRTVDRAALAVPAGAGEAWRRAARAATVQAGFDLGLLVADTVALALARGPQGGNGRTAAIVASPEGAACSIVQRDGDRVETRATFAHPAGSVDAVARRALELARQSPEGITHVISVGAPREPLAALFRVPPTAAGADAIAEGAARVGALAEGAEARLLFLDRAARTLALGIDGRVEPLLPAGSLLPSRARRVLPPASGPEVSALVLEDERPLARYVVSPLPAGATTVQLTFVLDADGLLTVEARDTDGGAPLPIARVEP